MRSSQVTVMLMTFVVVAPWAEQPHDMSKRICTTNNVTSRSNEDNEQQQ